MKPNYLKEDLDESNEKFLKYFALIDSAEILGSNRGMLFYLLPVVKLQKMIQWYASFSESEVYSNKEIRTKLESICSRFYGDGTLKILYKSLNQLITMTYTEPDKVSHDKDIKKMIKKIAIYIQQRLTDDDKEVFEKVSGDLDSVTKNISDKIDSIVLSSMTSPEKEEGEEKESEEAEEKQKESPESTDSKPKKESKISEYYRRRLGKKIREMVRSAIIDKKIRKNNRKA